MAGTLRNHIKKMIENGILYISVYNINIIASKFEKLNISCDNILLTKKEDTLYELIINFGDIQCIYNLHFQLTDDDRYRLIEIT